MSCPHSTQLLTLRPLLSYFAAQEIPAALVTFVSFLIFMQTGTSAALSTCYSALLSLPWMMKPLLEKRIAAKGQRYLLHCKWRLLATEALMAVVLLVLSASLNPNYRLFRILGVGSGNGCALFALLFIISILAACHEVEADTHYHTRLQPRIRRFYHAPRLFVSQSMVIATYGLLIVLVATLQVLSRSIYVGWSAGFVVIAAVMLLFLFWHLVMLHMSSPSLVQYTYPSQGRQNGFLLFILLLPQSLMLQTRVLFLLAPAEDGGLSRSLQEVGFAHGVVGAMAFSLGLMLSRSFVRRKIGEDNLRRSRRRFGLYIDAQNHGTSLSLSLLWSVFPLLLSPVVYCVMSQLMPHFLWQIAICTFLAQLMFGYGLYRLLSVFGYPASVGLRIPLVSFVMLLPIALSGWFVSIVGYQTFFLIDALTALLPFVALAVKRRK